MVKVEHLSYTYPGARGPVLKDISFDIHEGEIFGFLGPSGAGKSTTQKVLNGLLKGYQDFRLFQGNENAFELCPCPAALSGCISRKQGDGDGHFQRFWDLVAGSLAGLGPASSLSLDRGLQSAVLGQPEPAGRNAIELLDEHGDYNPFSNPASLVPF